MSHRAKTALINARKAQRAALGRVYRSPLLRWRLLGTPPNQLLFVPQELRTADPSFLGELQESQLGLAGSVVDLKGATPFRVQPPTTAWEESLHGFSWLRHLRATREEGGEAVARGLVAQWIGLNRVPEGVAFAPHVTARRVISWLCNAGMILPSDDRRAYETVMASLEMQLVSLGASLAEMAPGPERLTATMALVYAGLCIEGQDHLVEMYEAALIEEIGRQVLPSGGPVDRNPGALVGVLLDMLPLAQCYVARNRAQPEPLLAAIRRAIPWLRYMRMGNGQLGHFNGAGVSRSADIATLLAYDETLAAGVRPFDSSYPRLERGRTIVLMDAGRSPPIEHAIRAHAGCLSFEMSTGACPLIVNCGAPGPSSQDWLMVARSTAAHSTVTIEGASSAQLVQARSLERTLGGLAVAGPSRVLVQRTELEGAERIEASHDGYAQRFGLEHWRALQLSAEGTRLDGCDRLRHPDPAGRIKGDVSFAIHFHVYPDVNCRKGEQPLTAVLSAPNGDRWRLSLRGGASLAIEESTYLADTIGPRQSLQVVLRGRLLDAAEVHWRLERF